MFSIVYVTTGSMEEARTIAKTLVEMKLAACVNLLPIVSIYRWDGIQEENEVAMVIKTTYEQIGNIEKTVKEMHSYTVPCIISFSIDGGSIEYLDWIDDNVMPAGLFMKE
ncbi:MAG: divalent-cation tolerance protein CutA [Methanosarcinales archaeon]|nr:divalent-cation tolerance protein CutA [ANME-2 cluster archaeon]MDF1532342.1 divalent-cation tolerance protein CutA [ANME-2 cluster archaeon]MDW7775790.1 divalent-cation tolerance protein CutA [Methanosarcinales archaeon]